jgi:hypothetical protein
MGGVRKGVLAFLTLRDAHGGRYTECSRVVGRVNFAIRIIEESSTNTTLFPSKCSSTDSAEVVMDRLTAYAVGEHGPHSETTPIGATTIVLRYFGSEPEAESKARQ